MSLSKLLNFELIIEYFQLWFLYEIDFKYRITWNYDKEFKLGFTKCKFRKLIRFVFLSLDVWISYQLTQNLNGGLSGRSKSKFHKLIFLVTFKNIHAKNALWTRSMEYKGEGIDPACPTIWLYMLCRRYSICIRNIHGIGYCIRGNCTSDKYFLFK